jgi:hypothetical protein
MSHMLQMNIASAGAESAKSMADELESLRPLSILFTASSFLLRFMAKRSLLLRARVGVQGVPWRRQLGFLGGERARFTCCGCLFASLVVKLLVTFGAEFPRSTLLDLSIEQTLGHGIAPVNAVVELLGEDLLLGDRAAGRVLAAGLLDLTFLVLDGSKEPEFTCGRVHADDAGLALCPLTCFFDRLADAASARAWLTGDT